MRLEGTLDAFSLPDIFQLLSFTKKTGALHLRRGDVHGVVFFAAGAVTGASADQGRQALGRRLVGAGHVSDEALIAGGRARRRRRRASAWPRHCPRPAPSTRDSLHSLAVRAGGRLGLRPAALARG